jgi:hypothetical protein
MPPTNPGSEAVSRPSASAGASLPHKREPLQRGAPPAELASGLRDSGHPADGTRRS